MTILKTISVDTNVNLKQAFLSAGMPDSTYYRANRGKDLRYNTALKVKQEIEKLSALQKRSSSN
tara:strand:+ start:2891 stop:3082 length:192 start_codon:yes stop_codon:yes gene_type:complete